MCCLFWQTSCYQNNSEDFHFLRRMTQWNCLSSGNFNQNSLILIFIVLYLKVYLYCTRIQIWKIVHVTNIIRLQKFATTYLFHFYRNRNLISDYYKVENKIKIDNLSGWEVNRKKSQIFCKKEMLTTLCMWVLQAPTMHFFL